MPQVSKNKLEKELDKALRRNFYHSFVGLKTQKEAREFLSDLLTPTEKVMLAKRMGVAALLLSELKYRKVSGVLKVSYATVGKMQNKLRDRAEKIFLGALKRDYWRKFIDHAKMLLPYSETSGED